MNSQQEDTKASPSSIEHARILVIDDEEVIHVSLKRLLGGQGHEVDSVLSANEGIERLSSESYDMVITDLMMPEMNGIELLEQMRVMGLKLPTLMITGYPTIRTAMQAMRLGAEDYLAKPFRRQELLGPVNRMLRRDAMKKKTGASTTLPPPNGEPPEHVSLIPKAGVRLFLRGHSWSVFQQDGTAQVGIEKSFLDTIGPIESVALPNEAELVEQGFVGAHLVTGGKEEHGVFMPLSGQVIEVNKKAAEKPSDVDHETWLIQIVPSHFEDERDFLQLG